MYNLCTTICKRLAYRMICDYQILWIPNIPPKQVAKRLNSTQLRRYIRITEENLQSWARQMTHRTTFSAMRKSPETVGPKIFWISRWKIFRFDEYFDILESMQGIIKLVYIRFRDTLRVAMLLQAQGKFQPTETSILRSVSNSSDIFITNPEHCQSAPIFARRHGGPRIQRHKSILWSRRIIECKKNSRPVVSSTDDSRRVVYLIFCDRRTNQGN